MDNSFGKYLTAKRTEKNIPPKSFADKAGISVTYLSSIEAGLRPAPSVDIINKMIELLYLNSSERDNFYDLAALSCRRKSAPADIIDYINENKRIRDLIRAARDGKIPRDDIAQIWEKYFY